MSSNINPLIANQPSSYVTCTYRSFYAATTDGIPGSPPNSVFVPIAELERSDADLVLVFLSGNGVFFSEPLYDDWYRATEPWEELRGTPSIQLYRTSEAASPLACAAQWQFCRANTSACGPTASYDDAVSGAAHIFESSEGGSTKKSTSATDRFAWLMQSTGIGLLDEANIVKILMDSALLSKQSLVDGHQGKLPDNQWQLDVTNWFSVNLASVQTQLLQSMSGFTDVGPDVTISKPMTKSALKLCSNQVCLEFPRKMCFEVNL